MTSGPTTTAGKQGCTAVVTCALVSGLLHNYLHPDNQATFALQRYPDLSVAMLMSPNKQQLQPRTRDFRTDMRLALSDCVTSPRCLTQAFHSLRHQLSLNALITSYTPSWAPQGSKTADMRVDEAARQTERTSLDMADRLSLSPGHQAG